MVEMAAEVSGWLWEGRSLLPSLLLLACLFTALKVLDLLWWRPRRVEEHFARQGIKGPRYRFFLGNVREMVGLMLEASSEPMVPPFSHNILPRVLPFYHHWKKIYGSTFILWFGPTARLTVADPDLIREVLVSRSEFFERYESHPLVRQLEGEGLISLRGEKWARRRKIVTPTFHMENLKLLIPLIGKSVVDMLEKWSGLSPSGEVEVDVSEWFQSLTEKAITHLAFGQSYEDGKAIFHLQSQQMTFAGEAFRNVLIPGYRFLPTKKNTNSWKLDKLVRKSLLRLIGVRKERADTPETDNREPVAKDLLGLLIRASTTAAAPEKAGSPPTVITLQDIVEECKTFFFAGKQTTSNLMTWATVLLAMYPEWQDLARQEVLDLCGSRDVPTRDHVTKLKTLGMIMNETLRLYPPVVAMIRTATADVELGGCKVPRGTELMIPIMAVHHDARLWGPEAAQFNPGRFAEGAARAAGHPTAFIPFGVGGRTCVGQNLALLEAKVTLAILLQRFSFRISPSYVHAPTVLMLLYPQHGAPVIFRPLNQDATRTPEPVNSPPSST